MIKTINKDMGVKIKKVTIYCEGKEIREFTNVLGVEYILGADLKQLGYNVRATEDFYGIYTKDSLNRYTYKADDCKIEFDWSI